MQPFRPHLSNLESRKKYLIWPKLIMVIMTSIDRFWSSRVLRFSNIPLFVFSVSSSNSLLWHCASLKQSPTWQMQIASSSKLMFFLADDEIRSWQRKWQWLQLATGTNMYYSIPLIVQTDLEISAAAVQQPTSTFALYYSSCHLHRRPTTATLALCTTIHGRRRQWTAGCWRRRRRRRRRTANAGCASCPCIYGRYIGCPRFRRAAHTHTLTAKNAHVITL